MVSIDTIFTVCNNVCMTSENNPISPQTFEQAQLQNRFNRDRVVALRAHNAGAKLVGEAVEMVGQGVPVAKVRNVGVRVVRFWRGLDYDSTTLALNHELQEQGHDVVARVRPVDESLLDTDVEDLDLSPVMEILSIDGKPLDPTQR